MDSLKNLKIIVDDEITSFLLNEYEPPDHMKTLSLFQLRTLTQNELKGASCLNLKRKNKFICEILDDVICQLNKRMCTGKDVGERSIQDTDCEQRDVRRELDSLHNLNCRVTRSKMVNSQNFPKLSVDCTQSGKQHCEIWSMNKNLIQPLINNEVSVPARNLGVQAKRFSNDCAKFQLMKKVPGMEATSENQAGSLDTATVKKASGRKNLPEINEMCEDYEMCQGAKKMSSKQESNGLNSNKNINSMKCSNKYGLSEINSSSSTNDLNCNLSNNESRFQRENAHVNTSRYGRPLKQRFNISTAGSLEKNCTKSCPEKSHVSRFGRHLKNVEFYQDTTFAEVRNNKGKGKSTNKKSALLSHNDNVTTCNDNPMPLERNFKVTRSQKSEKNEIPSHNEYQKIDNAMKTQNRKSRGKRVPKGKENQPSDPGQCITKRKCQKKQLPVEQCQSQNAVPEKVTARKGTLKHLKQRHKRQQFLMQQQQQQEDNDAELFLDNPHLNANNRFKMKILQTDLSSGSLTAGGLTPQHSVNSSALLPMLSPMTPSSVSVGDMSFDTPRAPDNWDWLKNTPNAKNPTSPYYGGNFNVVHTPVMPEADDIHRIIFHRGKKSKKRGTQKRDAPEVLPGNCSNVVEDETTAAAVLPAPSNVRHKKKNFKWLQLPELETPEDTNDTDEEDPDAYFSDES
ncbi:uncharacterized protein LOC108673975 [Hyalella azteca]|uniref:Uncharacterized protein LOC108673975 n=1 Tax=Hyalella azteca TaxID=294128 RepID=A0A8B7NUF5_HYAAZ|nr:uncharacterized protein LOC108673975 [Hyalella azteca]